MATSAVRADFSSVCLRTFKRAVVYAEGKRYKVEMSTNGVPATPVFCDMFSEACRMAHDYIAPPYRDMTKDKVVVLN